MCQSVVPFIFNLSPVRYHLYMRHPELITSGHPYTFRVSKVYFYGMSDGLRVGGGVHTRGQGRRVLWSPLVHDKNYTIW